MKKLLTLILVLLFAFSVCAMADKENKKEKEVKIPDSVWKLDIQKDTIEGLKKYKKPLIIDFGAEWCGPCQKFHPTLEKMNKDYNKKVIIKYVDIDENRKMIEKLPIECVPTIMFWTAEGKPFIPSKKYKDYFVFTKDKKGNVTYSFIQGSSPEKLFKEIIADMGIK